ncbi:MAG: DUF3786 domain-containing protein [Thermodesulfobacteriota bacterium]
MPSAMFRSDRPTNYEEVYHGLAARLARADFRHARLDLGARAAGARVAVDVLGWTCLVGQEGIEAADGAPLDFTIRICLAYYILHGGSGDLTGDWVAYRDFKDGAFFHAAFSRIVENKIAQGFAHRASELAEAAARLKGESLSAGLGGDVCLRFPLLPKVPLALVFYEADEDFPASARVLYDASAPRFLDLECLAVLGLILADQLVPAARTDAVRAGPFGARDAGRN